MVPTLRHLAKRSQGTSTMGRLGGKNGPYGEHNANVKTHSGTPSTSSSSCARSQDRVGFSTAVEYIGGMHRDRFHMEDIMAAKKFVPVRDGKNVFGREMKLKEAALVCKSGEHIFDKIILLISHGEAAVVTEQESLSNFGEKYPGDLALTEHGIGQALKMLGKTGEYCNKATGLIPQLVITSPIRCATEAALLSFPYYSPMSIYGTQWICSGACHDSPVTTPIEHLERCFPDIDYSLAHQDDDSIDSDFLSWLSTREERVIAIASTPTWVNKFCDGIEPGNESKDLRVVGIKFTQEM